jgi:hypothetical protein
MEPEQIREFGQIRDEVTEKLRHHAYIDDRNAGHVFQYLIIPSFTPPISWDVFRRRKGSLDAHVLLRSSWRCDLDQEKLGTPVERLRHPYPLIPSIEAHELSAPPGDLERLAQQLGAIELPIGAATEVCGVDGVTFEIAVGQPSYDIGLSAKCRLSWWCDLPAPWVRLRLWLREAESVFEAAWSTRGDAGPVPLRIRAIDYAGARHEVQRLFHERQYRRVAELLAEIATREKLTPAETKMLELALSRAGRLTFEH